MFVVGAAHVSIRPRTSDVRVKGRAEPPGATRSATYTKPWRPLGRLSLWREHGEDGEHGRSEPLTRRQHRTIDGNRHGGGGHAEQPSSFVLLLLLS